MEYRRIFDDDKYARLAAENAQRFAAAQPFPHAVIDDFLPEDVGNRILDEFPTAGDQWVKYDDSTGLKRASNAQQSFGAAMSMLLDQSGGVELLSFLEQLTGITGLIPDPYRFGGGRHQIPKGGFLKIHADFTRHFAASDISYHGHPEPLRCPEGMTRKSIAQYYYTSGRPDAVPEALTTTYRNRPEELARMRSLGYRFRAGTARCLEGAASLAHKPAGLLRRLAGKIQPRY